MTDALELLLPGPPEPRDEWRWATVTQASPLRIRLDGEDTALPITPDCLSGGVSVGRRVWVQLVSSTGRSSRRVVVHGVSGGSEPVGILVPHAGGPVPATWALADGATVPRTGQYAALFAQIGTTWGAGNGTTTFTLPDLRDRALFGASASKPLGQYGGEAEHTMTIAELVPHGHSGIARVATGAGSSVVFLGATGRAAPDVTTANPNGVTSTGGGTPFPIIPPNARINWLIKL